MIRYDGPYSKGAMLCTHVTDLHAVEKYLLRAVEDQLLFPEMTGFPEAGEAIRQVGEVLCSHLLGHEEEIARRNASSRAAVKDSMTAVAGFALGLVNKTQPHLISRTLRDDAALLTLVSLGYGLFHAAALALGHASEAQRARENLSDLAPLAATLRHLIPEAVMRDLAARGFSVDSGTAALALENIDEAWVG